MRSQIKVFIESYSHLILKEDYATLYQTAVSELQPSAVGELTEVLLSADIPVMKKISSIPKYFLSKSTEIKTLIIPENIKKIEGSAFWGSSLETIELPDSLEEVEPGAFSASQIEQIHLGANIKSLGEMTFRECSKLEKVSMESCGSTLSPYTFVRCSKLKRLKIPSGCTCVDRYAFSDCPALEQIELPSNITFELSAVSDCPNLQIIKFANTTKEAMKLIQTKNAFKIPTRCEVQCTDGSFKLGDIMYE